MLRNNDNSSGFLKCQKCDMIYSFIDSVATCCPSCTSMLVSPSKEEIELLNSKYINCRPGCTCKKH